MPDTGTNIEISDTGADIGNSEYIRALEMSVELLQREVANLRKNLSESGKKIEPNENADINEASQVNPIIENIETEEEFYDIIPKYLSEFTDHIEGGIFILNPDNSVKDNYVPADSQLKEIITNFNENGIIDWCISQIRPSIIESPFNSENLKAHKVLIAPMILGQKGIGFYGALLDAENIPDNTRLGFIDKIMKKAALSFDNIASKAEINRMNKRLELLGTHIKNTGNYGSVGEISLVSSKEIKSHLDVIDANLDLIESGVGNRETRINIIRGELQKSIKLINKVIELDSNSDLDAVKDEYSIEDIISDVKTYIQTQLYREGIALRSGIVDNFKIMTNKSQLEQILINIILSLGDLNTEGGTFFINTFKNKNGAHFLTISDDNTFIELPEGINIFSPENISDKKLKKLSLKLYYAKSLIGDMGGNIYFESGLKGTSIKIEFKDN